MTTERSISTRIADSGLIHKTLKISRRLKSEENPKISDQMLIILRKYSPECEVQFDYYFHGTREKTDKFL